MDAVDRCLLQGERWFLDEMGLLWFRADHEPMLGRGRPALFDGFGDYEQTGCQGFCSTFPGSIPLLEEINYAKARAVLTMYYHDYIAQRKT